MAQLLHISYDLRNRKGLPVTTAVANLINETRKKSSIQVIDLLRVANFRLEQFSVQEPGYVTLNFFGLPYGIFMIYSLKRAYNKTLTAISQNLINIDANTVIHAHKVTFEGYIAYLLSLKYNSKLILTLRQSDIRVFQKRPDLTKHFKPVIERCDRIIYLIPSIVTILKNYLGEPFFDLHVKNKLEFIPNIVERDFERISKENDNGVFMTALRMDRNSVKRKNLKRLLSAVSMMKSPYLKLRIIGDGSYMQKVKRWVKKFEIENNILFTGAVPNSDMDKYYSSSKAFLLPSLSESFGLVYAEALLNGTPIMYSRNRLGFDGMFEGVGVGVDPLSAESIADGIVDLIKNNRKYRDRIRELSSNKEFEIFSSKYVENKYNHILEDLLK